MSRRKKQSKVIELRLMKLEAEAPRRQTLCITPPYFLHLLGGKRVAVSDPNFTARFILTFLHNFITKGRSTTWR